MTLGNAPCPCGSGLRFEHCHGRAAPGPAAPGPELDFVVVGTQRGGTSTLDRYLREHRGVAMPVTRKELHFFDRDEHFAAEPVDFAAYHANFGPRLPGQLRGEVTPSYMYWTPAAGRLARYRPALKIVILLRNPITRAYSHWNKARHGGRETLPFLAALHAESDRARAAAPAQDLRTSYVARGFYVSQLQRLWRHFPADQTLVIRSEALWTGPSQTLARIADFLGLSPFPRVVPTTINAREYAGPMQPGEWAHLADTFADEIRELERLLGWDCGDWLRPPSRDAASA